MKKITLLIMTLLLTAICFGQTQNNIKAPRNTTTYFSKGCVKQIFKDNIQIEEDKVEIKDRIILIGDTLIYITNYIGGNKTQELLVVEIKTDINIGKIYTCKTIDKDFINGYQDAVIYIKDSFIILAMFAGDKNEFIYKNMYLIDHKIENE